jgi:hypothetical protein
MGGRMASKIFFVPGKEPGVPTEQAYQNLARNNGAPVTEQRISALKWRHNGMSMSCRVGGQLPIYFETGFEPVLAIFDLGDHFAVCTRSRGGDNHSPVRAGKSDCKQVQYFSMT